VFTNILKYEPAAQKWSGKEGTEKPGQLQGNTISPPTSCSPPLPPPPRRQFSGGSNLQTGTVDHPSLSNLQYPTSRKIKPCWLANSSPSFVDTARLQNVGSIRRRRERG
jgi:hypothetical protein